MGKKLKGADGAMAHLEEIRRLENIPPTEQHYNKQILAERMQVSESTAYNNIQTLEAAGKAKKVKVGSKTWYVNL